MANKLALPKLGPTGKKVATGAAVAGVLTLAGIGISKVSKQAEQKRVLSAEGEMDKKYPFSQSCSEMRNTLKSAKLALAQLESESGGNAGAKRVRARNTAALKGRIAEIENYSLSLDCSSLSLPPQNEQGYIVDESGNLVLDGKGNPIPAENSSMGSNMTKYLLYGVAGVILLVVFSNLMRKKD
jgi:hypothetical protein